MNGTRRLTGFWIAAMAALLTVAGLAGTASAQWVIEESHTTAELRGIDSVGHGIAWASGSSGTVLRTLDDGKTWQPCSVPPDAAKLDFRGVQAFDADSAIVMSSGPGDASQLYKTSDGCKTWRMVFMNPDKDGFWDALQMQTGGAGGIGNSTGVLVGDPVGGTYAVFVTGDGWNHWQGWGDNHRPREDGHTEYGATAPTGSALFAASNGALLASWINSFAFVTGGPAGSQLIFTRRFANEDTGPKQYVGSRLEHQTLNISAPGLASGAFAVATKGWSRDGASNLMIVGGDYSKPEAPSKSIFIPKPGFKHPLLKKSRPVYSGIDSPHGYRSAVAFDGASSTWITVGPNGTDVSTNDGKSWQALKPGAGDAPDDDKQWNALSLPFVVGPKGRIGRLREGVLSGK